MIDEKRVKEAKENTRTNISEGLLKSKNKNIARFVDFFLNNSKRSLQTADTLFSISNKNSLKKDLKLGGDFESYLWVVVSSYYSMFYSALALLASKEYKIGSKNVHKVVADALISILFDNKKLVELLSDYDELKDEALIVLVKDYESERKKRGKFQYDVGFVAKRNFAQTSLERAKKFVFEIRNLIEK